MISVSVPPAWRQATAAEMPNAKEALAASLPSPSDSSDLTSVYVSVDTLPTRAEFKSYERTLIAGFASRFKLRLNSRGAVKLPAGRAEVLQFVGAGGEILITYLIPSGRQVYSLTFSTGQGAVGVFQPTFRAIATTLRTP